MTEHYAFCADAGCGGCLPSDGDLAGWSLVALSAEMLRRCIPQTPATRNPKGALAALVLNGPSYRATEGVLRGS